MNTSTTIEGGRKAPIRSLEMAAIIAVEDAPGILKANAIDRLICGGHCDTPRQALDAINRLIATNELMASFDDDVHVLWPGLEFVPDDAEEVPAGEPEDEFVSAAMDADIGAYVGDLLADMSAWADAQAKSVEVEALPTMLANLMADDDAELDRIASQPWLIDGLIPASSLGVIFGEPGGGKSFVAVDMAASVSTGTAWQGIDTGEPGLVVYIAAEGGGGLRFRKRAWEQTHGIRAPLLRIQPRAVTMDDERQVADFSDALSELARREGVPLKMVVVDTLNRTMAGEENSNTDMAAYVRGCERLQHDHGCGIAIIHHSGKDVDRGARGASALKAATDFEIAIAKAGHHVTVRHTRAKDTEPLAPIACVLDGVTVEGYHDHKGQPITSLVPRLATSGERLTAAVTLSDREQALLDVVRDTIGDDGGCDRGDVRDAFKHHPVMAGVNSDTARRTINRCLTSLRDRGMVTVEDDVIRLVS